MSYQNGTSCGLFHLMGEGCPRINDNEEAFPVVLTHKSVPFEDRVFSFPGLVPLPESSPENPRDAMDVPDTGRAEA